MNPILKWAGGKRWLAPFIRQFIYTDSSIKLVEPFAGALGMATKLNPQTAVLNDANPHLINFHSHVAAGLDFPNYMDRNDEESYYSFRKEFNSLIPDLQNTQIAAQYFYYLNRTCFNGLARMNNSGKFNVPYGKYKKINYDKDFYQYQETYSRWEFCVGDFETTSGFIDKNTFTYLDPPYDAGFTKYSKNDFTWEDQERLAQWAAKLPGQVVASNKATERIITLYQSLDFEVYYIEAPRRISCNGNRDSVVEMLATKKILELALPKANKTHG